MKKLVIIFSLFTVILVNYSCQDEAYDPGFEDMNQMSIYDFIVDSMGTECSSFLEILKAGELDITMKAYNPDGNGYTLFLPDNAAVDRFIENSELFNSLSELLNNKEYVKELSRYHVVNSSILANDFPFGAFPEPTLSKDYLTVSFIVETDTAYYLINNQAPVTRRDVEASNGYVHLISEMLTPVTFTTYQWLEQNSAYSIFKQAVDITGFKKDLDFISKDEDNDHLPVTLLIEPDSIFKKYNINSLNDLISKVSANNSDYTNELNPLYNFVGYHILSGNYYLNDFEGNFTNYSTYSDIPLGIDGTGIDIKINNQKQVLDTLINGNDTTFVDYLTFYYDASNILTQSGAVHFIDHVMIQQTPSMADVTYEFYEEGFFNDLRSEAGEYIIDDHEALTNITWTEGVDLFYVKQAEEANTTWSDDYIQIDGDFSITYRVPKIVQGKYNVFLNAEAINTENALVEVYIDGKKIGGSIDLSTGGSTTWPFYGFELGTIDFIKYEEHLVEIRSLIPGRFLWDYIRFEIPEY